MSIFSKVKQPFVTTSFVAVVLSIVSLGIPIYEQYFGKFPVLVNSSPSKAEIYMNGVNLGETPLTLQLERGTYSLNAKKKGYESLDHVMYVKSSTDNSVSLRLVASNISNVATPGTLQNNENSTELDIAVLSDKVDKLSSIIVLDPESAATVSVLTEKFLLQAEAIKSLRAEIKDVRDQNKWYIGSMIAIIVGLLGVIATLFIPNRGK
ncbi:PEGA domain-containing protein [Vibrio parahaemolyticus]